jgi:hypothetical protein
MKWACLVEESTNVVIQSKLSTMGKRVIKYMLIISQGRVALGIGRSEPSALISESVNATFTKVCNGFSHTRPPKHFRNIELCTVGIGVSGVVVVFCKNEVAEGNAIW